MFNEQETICLLWAIEYALDSDGCATETIAALVSAANKLRPGSYPMGVSTNADQ